MDSYGILSVLPVFTILVIAVSTRRTLFAMVCGLSVGALIIGKLKGSVGSWFKYIYLSMSNETLQWLLLVIALFGILIVLFEKSNAVTDFGYWAGRFIHTKRQAMFGTIILGIMTFLDDYLHNLAVGTTMKGITDRLRIPRSQLGFIVNCLAASVCVLIPISSWAVYFSALLEKNGVTVGGTGVGAYLKAIPFTFYAWIMVAMIILHAVGIIPKIGMIKKDSIRAEETGNVFPLGGNVETIEDGIEEFKLPEGYKPQPWNFLIPLVVMIVVTFATGVQLLYGSLAGVVVAFLLYLIQGKLKFRELLTYSYDGVISMGFVLILSVLAFSVQALNTDLGLADFIIGVTQPIMKGAFLPAVVFLVCGIYAYATGCFWDLAAIILPIVIPLAIAMGVDPILASAAVFSGAAFGSNTCLYGDGIIICSQGCQIKPIDLMFAILPYAAIAGGLTTIMYLIFGFVMQ